MGILNSFSNVIVNIFGYFLYIIVIGLNQAIRVDIKNYSGKKLFKKENFIFAIWHKNTFTLFYLFRNQNISIFVTDDLKGKILGVASHKLGYDPFSLERNLSKSIIKMRKKVKNSRNIAMAIDGPRGPYMCIKNGSRYLTKKTGVPTIAIAVHYSSALTLFWRWDKYQVPLPFSRAVFTFSQLFDRNSDWKALKEVI